MKFVRHTGFQDRPAGSGSAPALLGRQLDKCLDFGEPTSGSFGSQPAALEDPVIPRLDDAQRGAQPQRSLYFASMR